MAWAGWFGQEKKTRELNIHQSVATHQKHKNSRENNSKFSYTYAISTPVSTSQILKYTLSQSVCSIHYTWPIVSNPVSSIIHGATWSWGCEFLFISLQTGFRERSEAFSTELTTYSTSEVSGSAGPEKQPLLLIRRTAHWWLDLLQISQEGN